MTPAMPRFRRRLLAIRRERLALQNSLHKIASRLQNLISRLETLESSVSTGRFSAQTEGAPSVTHEHTQEYASGPSEEFVAGHLASKPAHRLATVEGQTDRPKRNTGVRRKRVPT